MAKNGVYGMILVYIICVNLFHINTISISIFRYIESLPCAYFVDSDGPRSQIYIYVVNPN